MPSTPKKKTVGKCMNDACLLAMCDLDRWYVVIKTTMTRGDPGSVRQMVSFPKRPLFSLVFGRQ